MISTSEKLTKFLSKFALITILIVGIGLLLMNDRQQSDFEPKTEVDNFAIQGYPGPTLSIWEQEIEMYMERLENEDLPDDIREGLEVGLAVAEADATRDAQMETRSAHGPPTVDLCEELILRATVNANRPPTETPSPMPSGIFDLGPPIPIESSFIQENAWHGTINNVSVWVHAGVYTGIQKQDMDAGAVYIFAFPQVTGGGVFYTPIRSGSVHIVDVIDHQLVLESRYGDIFYFDVPGQKFVSSLGDVVPTVAYLPTPDWTPTPPLFERICLTPTITTPPAAATEQLPITITPTWDSTGTPNYPTYTPTWAVTGTPDYPMTVTPEPTGYP